MMDAFGEELVRRAAWFEMRFRLRAVEGGSVPRFLGPALHGAFGHALLHACQMFPDAAEINDLCYSGDPTGAKPKNNPNWCQPFTFDIGLNEGGAVQPGKTVSATLVGKPLLASNAAYFPALLNAIGVMAQNGLGPDFVKFEVEEIKIFPAPVFLPQDGGIAIFPSLCKSEDVLKKRPFRQQAAITLETPTQLVSKGEVLQTADGSILLRRLWQRVVAWTDAETGNAIKPPFFDDVRVGRDSTHWWNVERYSTRQKKRIDVSGLVGKVTLDGLDEFAWQLLCIGERLHVGKNTTSGLGKYRIER